ncbi:hypothetical protein M406DRAFT_71458 [Cryphonectria parasitica EP155]|uniref:Uncharacterized protein n=1 Tax=Cryphonectria parasitica (strain ATCC 38755 / EP155) TaxID=660469 RepID=A0A9P4Y815_CRYP1|nr:uncharacterized protein M406DRAFT_71458 [Cryphonectria parasitica EP155]KAF3768451.1 hypothetical protein M406DRAFT_71458 [Cryphonectria parasitica EP155]
MSEGFCSPKRPDETEDEYDERWKNSRDEWRRNFVNDYYARKEARIPSPQSESDLDDEDMAHEVKLVEQDILVDAGLATINDLMNPAVYPQIPFEILGKSLSEVDPRERLWSSGPFAPYDRSPSPVLANSQPAEEDAAPDQPPPPPAHNRGGILEHKRKRGSEEEGDGDDKAPPLAISEEQPGPQKRKRRRITTGKETAPQPPAAETGGTRGYKRKRGSEEGDDHAAPPPPPATAPAGQPGPQKRRRMMMGKEIQPQPQPQPQPPAGTASGSKRKRRPDTACEAPQPVPDGPEAKKRKVVAREEEEEEERTTAADAASSKRDRSTLTRQQSSRARPAAPRESPQRRVQPPPPLLPTAPAARITRARRRQLSGADAQLLQLGQHGRAETQVQTMARPGRELGQSRRHQNPSNSRYQGAVC